MDHALPGRHLASVIRHTAFTDEQTNQGRLHRVADALRGPARRLAFYGRTNYTGEKAGTDVSRQYRACSAIAAEFGAMTQWFYDAPHALDRRSCLNVRDVESRLGTTRRLPGTRYQDR
jgi:hypothetical protein